MENSPLVPIEKNNLIRAVENKNVFSLFFYLLFVVSMISHSRTLLFGSLGICGLKIYKLYKNNKKEINAIVNYII